MRALLTAGSPMVTTSSVMAMAKTPSLRLAKRANSSSVPDRLYFRGPRRRAALRAATAPSSQATPAARWLALRLVRTLGPAGVADSPGLEEQAALGAGERQLLVGVDAAALDDLAGRKGAGRVVPAVGAYVHGTLSRSEARIVRQMAVACFTVDHLDDGTARLLDVFERRGLKTTVFVEGRFGEERPDGVADIVRRGHELGMHGWAHEQWDSLDADEEEKLGRRATEALSAAAGEAPRGFRAPGGARGSRTADLLVELGYRYDASLGDGMRVDVIQAGLAQVPFVWNGLDGAHYLGDPPPAAAA